MSKTIKEIEEQIVALKLEAEKIRNNQRKKSLEKECVKVVCSNCFGTGKITLGGQDILSDPPWQEPCEHCRGSGFLWARKFEGKKPYEPIEGSALVERY